MSGLQFYKKGALAGIDLAQARVESGGAIVDGDNFTQLQVTNGNTLGGYISTVDAGGAMIQEALLPGVALKYSTDGDQDDGSFLARQTAVGIFDITLNSGREVAFQSRFKVVEGALVAIFVGLAEAGLDQDIVADVGSNGEIANKDVCGFHCMMHATDVDIDGIVRIEGGAKTIGATTMTEDADDTFHTYGFRFDGATTLSWFVDDELFATQELAAATFPTGEALTPTFCIKTGAAVIKSLTIWDWVCVELLLEADTDD